MEAREKLERMFTQLWDEYIYYSDSYKTLTAAMEKIADGCDNPQEVAKETLKVVTGEIEHVL